MNMTEKYKVMSDAYVKDRGESTSSLARKGNAGAGGLSRNGAADHTSNSKLSN